MYMLRARQALPAQTLELCVKRRLSTAGVELTMAGKHWADALVYSYFYILSV